MKKRTLTQMISFLIILSTVFVSGCGSSTSSVGGDTSAGNPEDRVMHVAVSTCPTSFNPFFAQATGIYNIYGRTQVYDTLFCHDAEGNIVPSIVESYEMSEDNCTITMKLHEGVSFSNGEILTSEDAAFSIEMAQQAIPTAVYFEDISSIETPDPNTLVLVLEAPNAALFENLSVFGHMVCKKAYEELGDDYGMTAETTIGTGPYIVTEFTPEGSVTYKANENYFKGAPDVKNIEVKTFTNDETAIIALQTGELDYFQNSVPAISVDKLSKDPNLQLVNITSKKMYYIGMNCENGPFADPNMRKAVALAINRDDMNIMGTEGLGTVVYYPGYPTFIANPDINDEVAYSQNQEEARRLIKEAGYEGASLTISMENNSVNQLFATALQNQLESVGLNIDIATMEYTAFMSDVFGNGNFDLTMSFSTARTTDMDFTWTNTMYSGKIGSGNVARYNNPQMDALLKAAREELDTEARKEIYTDCINLYLEDLPILPVAYEYTSRVYNKTRLSIDPALLDYDNFYYFSWVD